jgi:hypothetical protein
LIQIWRGTESDRAILDSVYGGLFFGVPNHGIDVESLVAMVKDQPNQAFLHSLGKGSQLLRNQSREFPKAFYYRDSAIFCLYETMASPTAQKVYIITSSRFVVTEFFFSRWEINGP